MTTEIDTPTNLQTTPTSIAEALYPEPGELSETPKKVRYIYYRVAFFSVREALKLAKVSEKTLYAWRKDDAEFDLADRADWTEKRQLLANQYLNVEFTRNFHLVLTKDFDVLFKAATGETLNELEHEYLLKIRSHYTPQHLALIKQLAGEIDKGPEFSFTNLTLTIKREREELTISGGGK